jgi:hypothetical protein
MAAPKKRKKIMTQYQSPFISELRDFNMFVMLQGSGATQIPDCEGDQCVNVNGENLGSECFNSDPDFVQVRVLVPGSGNTTPPNCTIFVGSDQIDSTCTSEPSSNCPDTWLFSCTDESISAPDFSCPDTITVQCEEFSAVPCDNDIT